MNTTALKSENGTSALHRSGAADGSCPLPSEAAALLLMGRQTIRRYDGRPVPKQDVQQLLRLAISAPSAHNRQPWRFVVLRDASRKAELALRMGEALRRDRLEDGDPQELVDSDVRRSVARISDAPVAVLVCMTLENANRYDDTRRAAAERQMAVQGTAMAIQNLLLAASAAGLGACWMCAPMFCVHVVQDVLRLPTAWEPQALLTLGWPLPGKTARRTRFDIDDVVRWD